MMSKFLSCAGVFTFMVLALFTPISGNAQSVHGVLMVVKGDIQVTSAKTNQTQKSKVGDKVFPGDTIMAGVDSRAKIVMTDQNILNISPGTKIQIAKYEFKPEQDKKNVLLNVVYGKVRATVSQKYDGEKNQFNVKTPSAVAGVRGTDFITQHNSMTNTSKIITFSGKVDVGSGLGANGKIMNPVSVSPGQFTVASTQGPPAAPVKMSSSELQQINKETAVTDNGPKSDARTPSSSPSGEKGTGNKQNSGSKSDGTSDGGSAGKSDGQSKGSDGAKNESTKGDAPKSDGTKGDTSAKSDSAAKGDNNVGGPKPDSRVPASTTSTAMMGPSDADLTATSPSVGGPPKRDTAPPMDAVCTTCNMMTDRPVVIPSDFIRGAKTRLNIVITN